MPRSSRSTLAAFACCAYFLIAGLLWIGALGIHSDEALFSGGLYEPILPEYSMSIFKHRIALMVMTYVGTLKSLLYLPILSVWNPSPASIRIPVIIIGTLTVWLFYRLLLRTCGPRVALVGCALLATDPVFLLTAKWDWGPVAIQHFCLVAGALLVVMWHQERRTWLLAAGFFVFGLGVWDKAVFIWSVSGLIAGVVAGFPRVLFPVLNRRNITIATAALLLGALPLIIYNLRRSFVTFRSNATWSADALPNKITMLRSTLDGSALVGWTVRESSDGTQREPNSWVEKACIALSETFGGPIRSCTGYAFGTSLLLLPFVWPRVCGPVLFSVSFIAFAWLQMAFTKGAGTGPHHTVLLWPVPVLLMAVIFAAASYGWRHGAPALTAATCVLAVSNIVVTSTYYARQIRNGPVPAWTDAIYGLSDTLHRLNATQVNVVDYVFFDTIRLLHQGRILIGFAAEPATEAERAFALRQCSDAGSIFIALTQTEGNEKFLAFASKEGFQRHLIGVFKDRTGRPSLELFRFEKTLALEQHVER